MARSWPKRPSTSTQKPSRSSGASSARATRSISPRSSPSYRRRSTTTSKRRRGRCSRRWSPTSARSSSRQSARTFRSSRDRRERSDDGARWERFATARALRWPGEVSNDTLELGRQIVQVGGRPGRQHLGDDLVGRRPVRLRRPPPLRRQRDDARAPVTRVRLPPNVSARGELPHFPADERRLETGEPRQLREAHGAGASQRGEDRDRGLREVNARAFRSETRAFTARRHACDVRERLIDPRKVVAPRHRNSGFSSELTIHIAKYCAAPPYA